MNNPKINKSDLILISTILKKVYKKINEPSHNVLISAPVIEFNHKSEHELVQIIGKLEIEISTEVKE